MVDALGSSMVDVSTSCPLPGLKSCASVCVLPVLSTRVEVPGEGRKEEEKGVGKDGRQDKRQGGKKGERKGIPVYNVAVINTANNTTWREKGFFSSSSFWVTLHH